MQASMVPSGNPKARASIFQAIIILTKRECPMKRLFLLTLVGLLLGGTATAQPTYAQLMDRAGAQMNQKDFCAAVLTFQQAFADSTQAGPFDLFAGGIAAANCPGRQALAFEWLLRLPRRPDLPISGRDVENMAQEAGLASLRAAPQWAVLLARLRAVAARRDEQARQTAAAWVQTAEGRSLPARRRGRFAAAQPGLALYYAPADTVKVPYLVYVPRRYQPTRPTALLVYLHGGIASTMQFQHHDPAVSQEPIFKAADSLNALVLYPFGRKSFGWLEQRAVLENVRTMITQVRARYHIEAQRVYLGGMSNGGTAAYWYACQAPAGFAGFFALSARPASALGPLNFERLRTGAPLYSLHAEDDEVVAHKDVRAVYDEQRALARQWHFASRPTGGHGFLYGPDGGEALRELLVQLLAAARR